MFDDRVAIELVVGLQDFWYLEGQKRFGVRSYVRGGS